MTPTSQRWSTWRLAPRMPARILPRSLGVLLARRRGLSQRFCGRSCPNPGTRIVCRSRPGRQCVGHRENDYGGLAIKTKLVPGIDPGSHDQPRPRAILGKAHEGDNDRARFEPSVAAISSARNLGSDSSGRGTSRLDYWRSWLVQPRHQAASFAASRPLRTCSRGWPKVTAEARAIHLSLLRGGTCGLVLSPTPAPSPRRHAFRLLPSAGRAGILVDPEGFRRCHQVIGSLQG